MLISNLEQRKALLESLIRGESYSDWGRESGFLFHCIFQDSRLVYLNCSMAAKWGQWEWHALIILISTPRRNDESGGWGDERWTGTKAAKMELYWSFETHEPGLDHKAEYDHLVLFLWEICDGGQRQKVAARSYQGRRGLQRCTPQVISLDAIYAQPCPHYHSFLIAILSDCSRIIGRIS